MRERNVDQADAISITDDARRPFRAPRACGECGQNLGPGHGNRQYHPDCAAAARRRKARAHSASYRSRRANRPLERTSAAAPHGYDSPFVTVPGVALPGIRVVELRAALHGFMRRLFAHRQLLDAIPQKRFRDDKTLRGARELVAEGLDLVALLDSYLPTIRAHAPLDPEFVQEALSKGQSPYTYVRSDRSKPAAITPTKAIVLKSNGSRKSQSRTTGRR